jgi:RHS repeat-associated protein
MLIVQERSSGNTPQVHYTRGLDLSGTTHGAGGIGGLLMRSHGYSAGSWSSHNGYHSDANGNVTALVNSSGSLQANYKYDPYGGTLSSSGTLATANTMRFSSKPAMFSSTGGWGMYYYGYRFYDPATQRWLNRDPIGEEGGINLFDFVFNNPASNQDALGLSSVANPASVSIALEAEAAAAGYPSYAAWQAALRAAARYAAKATAAALALSQSQCKPKNDDPCKRFSDLKSYLYEKPQLDVVKGVVDVIVAKGSQGDLNGVPGLTPELKSMITEMYKAAVDCYSSRRDNTYNEERLKFLKGERPFGPGGGKEYRDRNSVQPTQ